MKSMIGLGLKSLIVTLECLWIVTSISSYDSGTVQASTISQVVMFSKFVSISGWIIGIFGSIIGYISYIDSNQTKLVLYDTKSEIVWRQTRYFPIKPIMNGETNLSSNTIISKTLLTIWNGNQNIIKPDDIRTPLKISFGKNSLFDAKVFEKISVVPENFVVERKADGELVVSWKIFDPGMALQIALLHNGEQPRMSLTSELGPQTSVRKYLRYGSVALLIFIAGIILSITFSLRFVWIALDRFLNPVLRSKHSSLNAGLAVIFSIVAAGLIFATVIFVSGVYTANLFGDKPTPITMDVDY